MKKIKILALSVVLALLFASISYALVLTDVQGTKYEAAVENLAEMKIINGYGDGTFKPQSPISRAEMAAVIIRTVDDPSPDAVGALPFTDLDAHWAKGDIALAYTMGIIKGATANLFLPSSNVTYGEAATMLVRALGYTDEALGGVWPDNFMGKAAELGIFDLVEEQGKASQPAIRGDIALMTNAVAQTIRNRYMEGEPNIPGSEDNGEVPGTSGKFIGLPLALAAEVNKDGDPVDELEFLFGNSVYYLNTKELDTITLADFKPEGIFTGDLYVAELSRGIIRSFGIAPSFNLDRYVELTADSEGNGAFRLVTDMRSDRMTVEIAGSSTFPYSKEATCYKAVFDGDELDTFAAATTSSIDEGDYVRAWDLDEEYEGAAVVLVVIDEKDVAAAIAYGIIEHITEE